MFIQLKSEIFAAVNEIGIEPKQLNRKVHVPVVLDLEHFTNVSHATETHSGFDLDLFGQTHVFLCVQIVLKT
jgi:hypothetical protein